MEPIPAERVTELAMASDEEDENETVGELPFGIDFPESE